MILELILELFFLSFEHTLKTLEPLFKHVTLI